MSATNILIECEYGMIVVKEGASGAEHELEWVGDGVRCYIKGKFARAEYWSACNLLNQWCQERKIPLHTIRRVKTPRTKRGRDTDTKRMF